MNVWPLTSISVEFVCWAIVVASCLVFCSGTTFFRILALSILFFASCFSISFNNSVEAPLLPIHTVGLSLHSCLFMNRFFPAVGCVILVMVSFFF